jgi:hypothetical protein
MFSVCDFSLPLKPETSRVNFDEPFSGVCCLSIRLILCSMSRTDNRAQIPFKMEHKLKMFQSITINLHHHRIFFPRAIMKFSHQRDRRWEFTSVDYYFSNKNYHLIRWVFVGGKMMREAGVSEGMSGEENDWGTDRFFEGEFRLCLRSFSEV